MLVCWKSKGHPQTREKISGLQGLSTRHYCKLLVHTQNYMNWEQLLTKSRAQLKTGNFIILSTKKQAPGNVYLEIFCFSSWFAQKGHSVNMAATWLLFRKKWSLFKNLLRSPCSQQSKWIIWPLPVDEEKRHLKCSLNCPSSYCG